MPEQSILASYDERFLDEYAGKIVTNPKTAIIELLANCWDSGSKTVNITWPEVESEGLIEIEDDGSGMTHDEFISIWPTLSYNRVFKMGTNIEMEDGTSRPTYGKNGVGRFGMFCFSKIYEVETWKNETCNVFTVTRGKPFTIEFTKSFPKNGSGTKISCRKKDIRNFLSSKDLIILIGSTFFNRFGFDVKVNGKIVKFDELHVSKSNEYHRNQRELIRITRLVTKPKMKGGIQWVVNDRPVGDISWGQLKGVFDTRRANLKEYILKIEVNCLADSVKPDWTGFKDGTHSKEVLDYAIRCAIESLWDVFEEMRIERKKDIVNKNLLRIKNMTKITQEGIGKFISEVLIKCPTITEDVLDDVVNVLTKCEIAGNKYALMNVLSEANPEDIDGLYRVLTEWTIREVQVVFDELNTRMEYIKKLRVLSTDKKTKEVSQLQPIFERCLWIFGPEFDAHSFTSNQEISTVLVDLFKAKDVKRDRKRPDFVVTSNSSIGIYSSEKFDDENSAGEVCGYEKVLIVELKKGGFTIGDDEINQAKKYAKALKESGKIDTNQYVCYVLGDNVSQGNTEKEQAGNITVIPMSYNTLCTRADSRTFHLIKKMRDAGLEAKGDDIINSEIAASPSIDIVKRDELL